MCIQPDYSEKSAVLSSHILGKLGCNINENTFINTYHVLRILLEKMATLNIREAALAEITYVVDNTTFPSYSQLA